MDGLHVPRLPGAFATRRSSCTTSSSTSCRTEVFPAEASYDAYREQAGPDDHTVPPVVEELKAKARERGLWNLFLPSESGLTQLEYAPLAELSGWSNELAPEAMNCQAPDTGNMELLHLIGTDEQKAAVAARRCWTARSAPAFA